MKKICQMGRERGIEVIIDGAHAFTQFPFKQQDLDCDYYGTSLHKWLLAPIGTGMLYVRKVEDSEDLADDGRGRIAAQRHPQVRADRHASGIAAQRHRGSDQLSRQHRRGAQSGTFSLSAAPLVRSAAQSCRGVKILNSDDPEQSCGIGFISVDGMEAGKSGELSLE